MATLGDIVGRLLGGGISRSGWPKLPAWPPDLFAVAATLVQESGCYAQPRAAATWRRFTQFSPTYRNEVLRLGRLWRQNQLTTKEWRVLRVLWKALGAYKHEEVCDEDQGVRWHTIALTLLSISDEASKGMGFGLPREKKLAQWVLDDYERDFRERPPVVLRYLPLTLARQVPPYEVCVLPKTRTTQNGHSLRALSHHLALLPALGEVTPSWFPGDTKAPHSGNLGLLLVPFPYRIESTAFQAFPSRNGAFFGVRQSWAEQKETATQLHRFLLKLLAAAKAKGMPMDGIVLPEVSLPWRVAEQVAGRLRKDGVEFFIAGALKAGRPEGAQNASFLAAYQAGDIPYRIYQLKHHRWKLTASQIKAYRLEKRLDPAKDWSERIDISSRTCSFHVFRHGACLATLICEDLARVDPVQRILRAVGPNLVIALLMDDAQLNWRWSGRFAGMLAEDPGAAVVTLTSVGMLRRSRYGRAKGGWRVALWQEPGMRKPLQLTLRRGYHALALQLRLEGVTEVTADGRSDEGAAVAVKYVRVQSVRAAGRWPAAGSG